MSIASAAINSASYRRANPAFSGRIRFGRGSLGTTRRVGADWRIDDESARWPVRRRALQYFGDWTDRIAKGELPRSKPPRPNGVERNIVVTSWEWATEKNYCMISSCLTAQSGGKCLRPIIRLAGTSNRQHADLGSEDPQGDVFQLPVRDPNMPPTLGPPLHLSAMPKPMPRRRTGATRRSGIRVPTTITRCSR